MTNIEQKALALVEIHDDAGWSLSLNFGHGDKARDRMRAFSDAYRTGQLVERDGVDLVGANTFPTEYARWLSSIEFDVRVHDLTADEVARLIAVVAPAREALAGAGEAKMQDEPALREGRCEVSAPDIVERLLRRWPGNGKYLNPDGPEAADRIEALIAENERLRRDKARLLDFARAIQTWRSDADSYDRECDNPQRNYCEDVELMEGVAYVVIRQVEARATLGEKQ